jgi:hypothetical protein
MAKFMIALQVSSILRREVDADDDNDAGRLASKFARAAKAGFFLRGWEEPLEVDVVVTRWLIEEVQ